MRRSSVIFFAFGWNLVRQPFACDNGSNAEEINQLHDAQQTCADKKSRQSPDAGYEIGRTEQLTTLPRHKLWRSELSSQRSGDVAAE